jgi:glycosyltransferase involved in cell wall biosynthesis
MTSILVITNLYPPQHYGGYELTCEDVVIRWRRAGHDVEVLTSDLVVDPDAGSGDPRVSRRLRLYWTEHKLLNPSLRERARIERSNHEVLQSSLDRKRPDVVSLWHMGGMSLGLVTDVISRDIPIVANVHDDWAHYAPQLDAWMRLFDKHRVLGSAVHALTRLPTTVPDLGRHAAFCFVSAATRQHAERYSRWRFPVSTVVWNGIDPGLFRPSGEPHRMWRGRLLYVGRLDERKGVHTLIKALTHLPDGTTLSIYGRGDAAYQGALQALAERLGVSDRITYAVADRAELPAIYADADVCVFPSEWDEPFGLVPLEAMACATPVVATGTGGSAEFCIDQENCLLFAAGSAVELAERIVQLARSQALRAQLVRGGLATAGELTIDRLADVLEVWHVAAASGFPAGLPESRRRPLSLSQAENGPGQIPGGGS